MEKKPYPPTLKEISTALWIAACAQEVVNGIIEKGHPPADAFMDLCHSLYELDGNLHLHLAPGENVPDSASDRFHWRAEEIYDAARPDGAGFLQLTSERKDERILDLKFVSEKSETAG